MAESLDGFSVWPLYGRNSPNRLKIIVIRVTRYVHLPLCNESIVSIPPLRDNCSGANP
jgi:hypothetical protein